MNAVLLKALVDQQKQQAQRDRYAQAFNALEADYRKAVEDAYGLKSADDWLKEGSPERTAEVLTSNILSAFGNDRVNRGRAGTRNMEPALVQLLRSQGFKDAFQGAREAELQIPTGNNIEATLKFFDRVRSMGGIPRNAQQQPKQTDVQEIRSIAEKYGY